MHLMLKVVVGHNTVITAVLLASCYHMLVLIEEQKKNENLLV